MRREPQVTLRPLKYDAREKRFASLAREIAGHRSVLYHGTRFPKAILSQSRLAYSDTGDASVDFTRSPEVAAYWALLPRDEEEVQPGIIILDRDSLRSRYRLWPHHDFYELSAGVFRDDMEERVWGTDIWDVADHLIGCVLENGSKLWTAGDPARRPYARGHTVHPEIVELRRAEFATAFPSIPEDVRDLLAQAFNEEEVRAVWDEGALQRGRRP